MKLAQVHAWDLTPYGLRLSVPIITMGYPDMYHEYELPRRKFIVAILDLRPHPDSRDSVGIMLKKNRTGAYEIREDMQAFVVRHRRTRQFFGFGKPKKAKTITLVW